MIKWKVLFLWILLLQFTNVEGIWREWLLRLCIQDLNIPLNVVSEVVEVEICRKLPYIVVIHLLALSPKRNISLKENINYLTFCISANFKSRFEVTKVTFTPRKIVAVWHDILTINVVIPMIHTNTLLCK